MTAAIHPSASGQMAAWFARRPSFALMGEYSAGKSALLNALLGQRLLPTRVTATDLPAVWITHGTGLRVQGLTFAGQLVELAVDDLTSDRAMDFLCIRIECDAPFLTQIDIIDTPGISDPRMTTVIVEEILNYIDFAIWCSPINQAWRQTERAFWNRVPPTAKSASVLALTRADVMRSPADVGKVVRRCKADTAGSFASVMPVSALMAETAMHATAPADRKAMLHDSGLPVLQEYLTFAISIAASRCAERGKRLVLSVPIVEPPPVPARKKPAKAPKPSRTEVAAPAKAIVQACTRALRDATPEQVSRADVLGRMQQVEMALRSEPSLTAEHLSVLMLALKSPTDETTDFAKVLTQVLEELEDFAAGPWCTIDD
jgi:hypothetical protein